jgi:hypothetical protein
MRLHDDLGPDIRVALELDTDALPMALTDSTGPLARLHQVIFQGLADVGATQEAMRDLPLKVARWLRGYAVPLSRTTQTWRLIFCLEAPSPPVAESGALVLHDPRTGDANVSIPGLPFGRPLVLTPAVGLLLITPGWLALSVMPIDQDGEYVMITSGI